MHPFFSFTDSLKNSFQFLTSCSPETIENDSLDESQNTSAQDLAKKEDNLTPVSCFLENFIKNISEESVKKQKVCEIQDKTFCVINPLDTQLSTTEKNNNKSLSEAILSNNYYQNPQDDFLEFLDEYFGPNSDFSENTHGAVSQSFLESSKPLISGLHDHSISSTSLTYSSPTPTNLGQTNLKYSEVESNLEQSQYNFFNTLLNDDKNSDDINWIVNDTKVTSETVCLDSLRKVSSTDRFIAANNNQNLGELAGRVINVSIGAISFFKILGSGAFGDVYEGKCKVNNKDEFIRVAIKVNHVFSSLIETQEVYDHLNKEILILKRFKELDPHDKFPLTRYIDSSIIEHKRMCLIEPLYSSDLYKLIKGTSGHGFSFKLVYKIAVQLFSALKFFQNSSIGLVHFDLKPENIVFEHPNKAKIRIIDFGSAKIISELNNCQEYLVTRYYRPPEVVLNLPYTFAVDVWSVACILVEMHIAQPIFPAQNTWELLVMIQDLIGPIPYSVVKEIKDYENEFYELLDKPGFYTFKEPLKLPSRYQNRKSLFNEKISLDYRSKTAPLGSPVRKFHSQELCDLFKDMILSMFKWSAQSRMDSQSLLNHPFMQKMHELLEQANSSKQFDSIEEVS